jgi:arylsulfatase A-like enzyme
VQGRSLVPLLREPTTAGKETAYTVVRRGNQLGKAIRTEEWRYAVWPDGEELYDLRNDPAENKNLADSKEHAEIVLVMRAHLVRVESRALQND